MSIGYDWRSTIMANAARDPYWHAAVRREVTDHPNAQAAIEDKCSTCHMPMARFDAAAAGGKGQVFANIPADAPMHRYAFDGVSCTVCHQIAADNLGQHASFDGSFEIKPAAQGTRPVYGPHEVEAGRLSVMQSSAQYVPTQSQHVQRSELCATCHTLYTTALNAAGEQVGELPEQVPCQEWYASAYRTERTCQSCHMPRLDEQPISSVLGRPRPELSQHTFRGGNAFMLGIFNRYRGELGVQALPQELDAAIAQTETYLGTAAATIALDDVRRTGSTLALDVAIASTTGHKLPTAYPARRAWLHLTITDDSGTVLFESGRVRPDGSIVGNDNDADAGKFEPHYAEITSPEQVQIYESIMVDANGRPTTNCSRHCAISRTIACCRAVSTSMPRLTRSRCTARRSRIRISSGAAIGCTTESISARTRRARCTWPSSCCTSRSAIAGRTTCARTRPRRRDASPAISRTARSARRSVSRARNRRPTLRRAAVHARRSPYRPRRVGARRMSPGAMQVP